ncbi:MAG: hypothetical protein B6242_13385 [Anaerolineaceae bacterium 4572_78]|nr:MAG: hypothetical protein B6242_13385 [Anaerolineaceae bacterium 4572_78]
MVDFFSVIISISHNQLYYKLSFQILTKLKPIIKNCFYLWEIKTPATQITGISSRQHHQFLYVACNVEGASNLSLT